MPITIVTRAGKGAPLNATEHDQNLTNIVTAVGEKLSIATNIAERLHETENVKEIIWYSSGGLQATTNGLETLGNKTIVSPVITNPVISDLLQSTRETVESIDYTP